MKFNPTDRPFVPPHVEADKVTARDHQGNTGEKKATSIDMMGPKTAAEENLARKVATSAMKSPGPAAPVFRPSPMAKVPLEIGAEILSHLSPDKDYKADFPQRNSELLSARNVSRYFYQASLLG